MKLIDNKLADLLRWIQLDAANAPVPYDIRKIKPATSVRINVNRQITHYVAVLTKLREITKLQKSYRD